MPDRPDAFRPTDIPGPGEAPLPRPWSRSVGARVVAVQLHPGRCRFLRERFAADPVTVVRADVVTAVRAVGGSGGPAIGTVIG